MTMQFAMVAKNRAVVLASDTKVRNTEKLLTRSIYTPEGVTNHSKVRICERHQIAVAMAGVSELDEDPAQELVDYLTEQKIIPDPISMVLRPWGDEYFRRKYPNQKHEFPIAHLIVVHATTGYCQLWRLRVAHESSELQSETCMMNGQDRSPVVFWPEYLKCDRETYDLGTATTIAATAILMGGELNPYGVGGLEIWQYDKKWKRLPFDEIERLKEKFRKLQDSIHSAVLR